MGASTSPYEQTYLPESTTSLLPYCITQKQSPLGHPIVTSVSTLAWTDALGASKMHSQTLVCSSSFYVWHQTYRTYLSASLAGGTLFLSTAPMFIPLACIILMKLHFSNIQD